MRDHSSPSDVLATNRTASAPVPTAPATARLRLSAYDERRVLVEGWAFAPGSPRPAAWRSGSRTCCPQRRRLHHRPRPGSPSCVHADCVRWLVVDRQVAPRRRAGGRADLRYANTGSRSTSCADPRDRGVHPHHPESRRTGRVVDHLAVDLAERLPASATNASGVRSAPRRCRTSTREIRPCRGSVSVSTAITRPPGPSAFGGAQQVPRLVVGRWCSRPSSTPPSAGGIPSRCSSPKNPRGTTARSLPYRAGRGDVARGGVEAEVGDCGQPVEVVHGPAADVDDRVAVAQSSSSRQR